MSNAMRRVSQRAVLVTGASSGIGRMLTERLSSDGHFVFAGARKQCDIAALQVLDNVQAIPLDVTDVRQVREAGEIVADSGRGLYGLVNNAGIVTVGPIVGGDDAEFSLTMAVNVMGPYYTTRTFAPQVVAQRGRIVQIGSISGILAVGDLSAYCMSKHAIEAFNDSLAIEMEPLGVTVSIVEPGNFNTSIARNAIRRLGEVPRLPADRSTYKDPVDVVTAILHALFAPKPKRRYMVVSSEDEARATIAKQISQLVELNEGHGQTLNRSTIIEILDETLATSLDADDQTRIKKV